MIEKRIMEDAAKPAALREAAKIGMASIEAGEVRTFAEPASLRHHLKDVAAKTIANVGSGK